MARQAKPWYRASSNSWYVKVQGRQIALGVVGKKGKSQAYDAWHKLNVEGVKPKPKASATVGEVVDAFLADIQRRQVSLTTLRQYRLFLRRFKKRHKTLLTHALTPDALELFARKPTWSSTYRANIIASVVTAFRWAERVGIIADNPVRHVRKPPKASRGAKAIVGDDVHVKLCNAATSDLRAILILLRLTGARPSEIANLHAEDINYAEGVAIVSEHKTAHLGRRRILFLTPDAMNVIKSLGVKSGPLFRELTAATFGLRLWRLARRLGVKATLYGYRHTFATMALAKGIPDAHVAALLGHSSTAMLYKHYGHLGAYAQTLKEAMAKAST